MVRIHSYSNAINLGAVRRCPCEVRAPIQVRRTKWTRQLRVHTTIDLVRTRSKLKIQNIMIIEKFTYLPTLHIPNNCNGFSTQALISEFVYTKCFLANIELNPCYKIHYVIKILKSARHFLFESFKINMFYNFHYEKTFIYDKSFWKEKIF